MALMSGDKVVCIASERFLLASEGCKVTVGDSAADRMPELLDVYPMASIYQKWHMTGCSCCV